MHMFILGKYISIKYVYLMFANVNYHNFLKEYLIIISIGANMWFSNSAIEKV